MLLVQVLMDFTGDYDVLWFKPRSGGELQAGSITNGFRREAPPAQNPAC